MSLRTMDPPRPPQPESIRYASLGILRNAYEGLLEGPLRKRISSNGMACESVFVNELQSRVQISVNYHAMWQRLLKFGDVFVSPRHEQPSRIPSENRPKRLSITAIRSTPGDSFNTWRTTYEASTHLLSKAIPPDGFLNGGSVRGYPGDQSVGVVWPRLSCQVGGIDGRRTNWTVDEAEFHDLRRN